MDISSIFSVIGGAVHLAIDIPVLAIGVFIGAFGLYYLMKTNPTLLGKIVSAASAELQKVAAQVAESAAKASAMSSAAASLASLNAKPAPAPVVPVAVAPVAVAPVPVQAAQTPVAQTPVPPAA